MAERARQLLEAIAAMDLPPGLGVMNVCGGHERVIATAGLRSALPAPLRIIPGPGCPVCVCPEEDLHLAIRLALDAQVMLLTFGDMMRVPVNAPRREARTLEQARERGADVRAVASPQQAVKLAASHPDREVVLFVAGFETTMAPLAGMLAQQPPQNLSVLLSGRRTWPAVRMLLDSGEAGFQMLLAPGHVAAIMGADEWRFVAEEFGIPTAIAGFTPAALLAALQQVLQQHAGGRAELHNAYPQVVSNAGNQAAQATMNAHLRVTDANWRGIGVLPRSGFEVAVQHQQRDVRARYPGLVDSSRKRAGEMPPGCDCARVVLGRIAPDQCRLYGRGCNPQQPVGPCMVSDEGACRIWWDSGVRESSNKHAAV